MDDTDDDLFGEGTTYEHVRMCAHVIRDGTATTEMENVVNPGHDAERGGEETSGETPPADWDRITNDSAEGITVTPAVGAEFSPEALHILATQGVQAYQRYLEGEA